YARRADPVATVVAADQQHVRIIDALVGRLRDLIAGLPAPSGPSVWSDYEDRSHYSSASLAAKDAFVARAVERIDPDAVVDLGCNDGRYARAVADRGASVLAIDADRMVVDQLYQQLGTMGRAAEGILPSVADLADPSPSLGWGLSERTALG